MKLQIPELSLVALIGASGSGKSTFAARHFLPTEVLSSDACRAMVADDENAQQATTDAFDVLHYIAGKRLGGRRLTVVDATSVFPEDRRHLIELARDHDVLACAIVFNLPQAVCAERNAARPDRNLPPHALRRQVQALRRSLRGLRRERFHHVWTFSTPEEVEEATVERVRLWTDRRDDPGPFDIIGDVHGCYDELVALLGELGYTVEANDTELGVTVTPPQGRTAVFLGDLADRGPATPAVYRLVMSMVGSGAALCVPGNHDVKLMRALSGRNVQVTHGLAESLEQLAGEPPELSTRIVSFVDGLVSHLVLDGGRLVVAHAGLKERYQGRASRRVRDFALYGETTGETDEFGLPVRYEWAAEYRGDAAVVYGHTPVPEPEWINNTICVDTGCVFGGRLTALRWPERELVAVPAQHTYYAPAKPFLPADVAAPATQTRPHDQLDITDVLGKRIVSTRLAGNVTVREERATAALEVMSRFALDPRWLVYLPPTMAPSASHQGEGERKRAGGRGSQRDGFLEHPREAFAWYREAGIGQVVCEEKHMGSRAVVVVTRDDDASVARFGQPGPGACFTRTGRRFFADGRLDAEVLTRIRAAVTAAGLWDELATSWLVLDCEILPWTAKAEQLVIDQFAAVGTAARLGLGAAVSVLEATAAAGRDVEALLADFRGRLANARAFTAAYRRYVWPVSGIADIRIAPFHLLASQGAAHVDKTHRWHLDMAGRLAAADDALFMRTPSVTVDLSDPSSEAAATDWWCRHTESGGEGMVVKPAEFIARGRKGVVQPAIKVRGREYLRIIYGPDYTRPEHLDRLRQRGLGVKRGLAFREFALGVEALERFVRDEPLYRVHEAVFAILALESEPVDPRL
jgi:protein phosphatase